MIRKRLYIFVIFIIILIFVIICDNSWPKQNSKPFADLDNEDIAKIYAIFGGYPIYELTLEEQNNLVTQLREVKIFNKDDSWLEYLPHQGLMFYIGMKDCTVTTISVTPPFFIIDGVGYQSNLEFCNMVDDIYWDIVDTKIKPSYPQ